MEKYKRNRILVFGSVAALVIVALSVSLGFLIHDMIYSAKVSVMVAPYIAQVKVGEVELGVSGEIRMQPGEYAVEVSAAGFATKTGRITLASGETAALNLYLEPNSEGTSDWYETHAEDALVVGEIQNAQMMEAVSLLLEKEPALTELPKTVEYYSDDYSEYTKYILSYELDDSDRGFYIIMKDYTGVGMIGAIRTMAELGMDVVGVEVKYENLEEELLNGRAE